MKTEIKEKYLALMANCIPVKGISRSVICDLQRNKFDFIPNDLFEILSKFSGKKIEKIIEYYQKENEQIILEYLSFLIKEEYCEVFDSKEQIKGFMPLINEWDYPSLISNAIIDISSKKIPFDNYAQFLKALEELNCRFVEIRFYKDNSLPFYYKKIFETIMAMDISSIEVIMPMGQNENFLNEVENFINTYDKIIRITITGCNADQVNRIDSKRNASDIKCNIFATDEVIKSDDHCGFVSPNYFVVNEEFYLESQIYNSCLNRKLSIDTNGNIKNCPSCSKEYGKIGEIDISAVVKSAAFQSVWKINKNQINTCKICEFRYMCPDCRASAKNLFGKPKTCSYDPINCTWA